MRTNTRIVLTKYRNADVYLVKEVVGSLEPVVGQHLSKQDVQKLIDERSNTVVIRAGK